MSARVQAHAKAIVAFIGYAPTPAVIASDIAGVPTALEQGATTNEVEVSTRHLTTVQRNLIRGGGRMHGVDLPP